MPRSSLARVLGCAAVLATALAAPAQARILRDLDFQTRSLLRSDGSPTQWDNYVPERGGTSGVTLSAPAGLPFPYSRAARFQPPQPTGRPRSMVKLSRTSTADKGIQLSGPLDAAQGEDRYYRWSTQFPAGFDLPVRPIGAPTVFMAWHNNSAKSKCNTNVQMHAKRLGPGPDGLRLKMRVQGGRFSKSQPTPFPSEGGTVASCFAETFKNVDLGPVHPGRWTTWAIHIHWSSHPADGVIEVRRDGQLTRIEGANLYRSADDVPETGVMEQGIYSPVDTSDAARQRFLWQAGMTIGDAPEDLDRPSGCRRLTEHRHGLKVSRRATSRHKVIVRAGGLKSVSAAGHRYRARRNRAKLPVTAFGTLGRHRAKVRIAGRKPVKLRVTARPCF